MAFNGSICIASDQGVHTPCQNRANFKIVFVTCDGRRVTSLSVKYEQEPNRYHLYHCVLSLWKFLELGEWDRRI